MANYTTGGSSTGRKRASVSNKGDVDDQRSRDHPDVTSQTIARGKPVPQDTTSPFTPRITRPENIHAHAQGQNTSSPSPHRNHRQENSDMRTIMTDSSTKNLHANTGGRQAADQVVTGSHSSTQSSPSPPNVTANVTAPVVHHPRESPQRGNTRAVPTNTGTQPYAAQSTASNIPARSSQREPNPLASVVAPASEIRRNHDVSSGEDKTKVRIPSEPVIQRNSGVAMEGSTKVNAPLRTSNPTGTGPTSATAPDPPEKDLSRLTRQPVANEIKHAITNDLQYGTLRKSSDHSFPSPQLNVGEQPKSTIGDSDRIKSTSPTEKDHDIEESYQVILPPTSEETQTKSENHSSNQTGAGSGNESLSYLPAFLSRKKHLDTGDAESDAISISNVRRNWRFPDFFRGKTHTPALSNVDATEKDIIIIVTGRVGIDGKRSFIDDVFGDNYDRHDTSSPKIHFIVTKDPGDSGRKIYLIYSTGSKEQKLSEGLRHALNWLSEGCGNKKKFSGLIYLDDSSTSPPGKLSRSDLDLIDKCVWRPNNIVVATMGWDDEVDSRPLEIRHKELIDQWRSFVDRGVSVLRLSVPGKISRDVSHTSWDVVKHLITKNDDKSVAPPRAFYRAKEKKVDDKFLEDPRDTDIVIPIMGPTGAGKSTLINYLVGASVAVVGHNLKSETAQLQHVILPHPTDRTRRIIVVDTPGFDDTYVADSEILRRIAVWLARSYSSNMTLAGVIYLHEISQTRMLGTARKNLDMFNKLIGEAATKNVVLATTKWGEIPPEVGARREEQLRDRHWKWMVDLGAKLFRFEDSQESGQKIIQHIIEQEATQGVDNVEIQQELVEVKKILPDTEAGQALLYTLEELLESQRTAAAQLRQDESSDQVKAIMQETDQKIRATLRQINDLSGNRLRAWWNSKWRSSPDHR